MDLTQGENSTLLDTMRKAILDAWIDGKSIDGFDITRDQFYYLEGANKIEARRDTSGDRPLPHAHDTRLFVAGTAFARVPQ